MSPLPPSASSATALLNTIFPQSTSAAFVDPFSVSESEIPKATTTATRAGGEVSNGAVINSVAGGIEVGISNNPVVSNSETGVKEGIKSEIEGRPGKEYMPHYPDSVLIDPPSTPKIDTATIGCIIVGIVFAFLLVLVGVHRYLSKKEKVAEAEAAEAAAVAAASTQGEDGYGGDEDKSGKLAIDNDGKVGEGANGFRNAKKVIKQEEEEFVPPPTYTPGFMGRAAVNYHDVDLETGIVHPGNGNGTGNGKVNNNSEVALVDYKVRLARLGSLGMW